MSEPIYGQTQTAGKLQGPHTVGTHIAESDSVTKRIYELMLQLTRTADHLTGVQPTPVTNARENPEPPAGSINLKLQRQLREQNALLNFCVEQANRIESALGEYRD